MSLRGHSNLLHSAIVVFMFQCLCSGIGLTCCASNSSAVMAVRFTNNEYTDIIIIYGGACRNAVEARRLYYQRFPMRRLTSRDVFRRTEMRLRVEGAFQV